MRARGTVWNRAGAPADTRRPAGAAWYQITNVAGAAAEMWIYDEIGAWGLPATDLVKDLAAIKAGVINLHLNSPGGEVFDGMAIYNALKSHRATVNVSIEGIAASIATVIAMAGDHVSIAPQATMMIHEAHMLALGNAAEMTKAAANLERCSANIASVYAERTGVPEATWRDRMQAETWYSAKEAVAAGLADEVLANATPGGPRASAGWDLSVYNFAGRAAAPAPDVTRSSNTSGDPGLEPDADAVAPLVEFDPRELTTAFAGLGDTMRAALAPDQVTIDPDVFRAAMRDAATHAAAPDAPKLPGPAPDENPSFGFDPAEFARAIREGRT